MITLITFLEALIISGTIVYAIYGLMRLAACCVLWSVRKLSLKRGRAAVTEYPASHR